MNLLLATLCLNEMEWLPRLYEQHKGWSGRALWCFVEGADREYAQATPGLVTDNGLSTDGTSEYLNKLVMEDFKTVYIPHGWSTGTDKAQGKCSLRNRYLEVADGLKPDYVVVIDADEFYTHEAQQEINRLLSLSPRRVQSLLFKQRQIWRPPSMADQWPLLEKEVVGGFWSIPHCRVWRWHPGMRYRTNHNTPEHNGSLLDEGVVRYDSSPNAPQCVHLGYAAKGVYRAAKNRYYEHRGETVDPKRSWYTQSRAAWESWTPEAVLPRRASVIPYAGSVPEVFSKEVSRDQ